MTKTNLKHSGVEWLGQIPKHWEIVPLRAIYKKFDKRCGNENFELLSVTIEKGIIKQSEVEIKQDISNDDKSKYKIVPLNAVAYNKMRMWQGAVGMNEICEGIVSPAYIVAYPTTNFCYKFFAYLFRANFMLLAYNKFSYGICQDQNTLRADDFLSLKIPLPPLNEQRQIAEFLDKKCEKISEFIAKKQRLITLLKEQKQTLINECVCGRLDFVIESERSEVSPSLRDFATQNRGNPQKTTTKGIDCHEVVPTSRNDKIAFQHSGVEWLGQIPKHWEVRKLKQIGVFDKGLNITKENLKDNGIFVLNYGEIHSKYPFEVNPQIHQLKCVDENFLNTNFHSLLHKGDFVFADTSEDIAGSGNFSFLSSEIATFAGYHTIIYKITNLDCHENPNGFSRNDYKKAKLDNPSLRASKTSVAIHKINAKFLAYEFESGIFRSQIQKNVNGVKVYSITQNILKDCEAWIPPLNEQRQIAEFLDKKCEKIDKAIGLIEQEINKMKEYKTSLIDKAVKGQINA